MQTFLNMRFLLRGGYIGALFLLVLGYSLFISHKDVASADSVAYPNLKVAFVGDDGIGQNNTDVLNLIKSEGAQFAVDSGDLDYTNNPTDWDTHLTSVLGASYPYFVAEGNHDMAQWPGYAQKLTTRHASVVGETCTGAIGQMQACTYKDVLILLLAPGMTDAPAKADQAAFITQQLAASNAKWKICSWHYNVSPTDNAPGNAGPEVYEACRKGGAIIANAHYHFYMRTKTFTDIPNRVVDPNCNLPNFACVALGKTFVFISGLGGKSLQAQSGCLPTTYPYGCDGQWAKIYTADQSSNYGALFIIFNYLGNPNRAYGYFKTVDGAKADVFDIALNDSPAIPAVTTALTPNTIYKFVHISSGKVLNVNGGGTTDGTKVAISTDTNSTSQQWIYKNDMLINVNSNKALDVPGANPANLTNLQIYTQSGSDAQLWQPVLNSDGSYTLVYGYANKALDVYRNGSADGTAVEIYTQNGTAAQKWKAIAVGTVPTATPTPIADPTSSPSNDLPTSEPTSTPIPTPTNVPTPTPTLTPTPTPTTVPTPTPTKAPTPTPAPISNGLTGSYFANATLTGTPTVVRIDPFVNFNWSTGSPATGIPADNFSVRWTGYVVPKYSQKYTFYTQSDDGVRLWVNGVQLVNNWTNHSSTTNSGTITLTAGVKYSIKMEYYDKTSYAVAGLFWSSSSQAKQAIPQSQLLSK